ncbi:MAG: hypothetical protein ACKE8R_05175 [Methylophagaceae bacterium]
MKNIFIIVLIAAAFLYFTSGDDVVQSISFDGEEYKLAQEEGKKGVLHQYTYTKSGRFRNLDDYVQIFIVDKAGSLSKGMAKMEQAIRKTRKLNPVTGSEGEFGAFYVSPETRQYYGYYVFKETTDAYWIVSFIIASNLGKNALNTNEAKNRADNYINELVNIFAMFSL